MAQMEREEEHGENIKQGDVNILKPVNHHRIDVVLVERIRLEQEKARVGDANREMRDVINDKGEDDQPA
jgi:hypothetical protein